MTLLLLTVAISLILTLYLLALNDIQDSIRDDHSRVYEPGAPGSPFHTPNW